jgi:hypothetical protein
LSKDILGFSANLNRFLNPIEYSSSGCKGGYRINHSTAGEG